MVKFRSSSPTHTERHNLGSPETQFEIIQTIQITSADMALILKDIVISTCLGPYLQISFTETAHLNMCDHRFSR